MSVPTCFPNVTATRVVPPWYNADAHATAVADVHEELLHSTDSWRDTEGVESIEAKLIPLMVNDAPTVGAAFLGIMTVKTGAAHSDKRSRHCMPHGAQRSYHHM